MHLPSLPTIVSRHFIIRWLFLFSKNDPTYGIPTNEKTLKRGQQANAQISREVEELCEVKNSIFVIYNYQISLVFSSIDYSSKWIYAAASDHYWVWSLVFHLQQHLQQARWLVASSAQASSSRVSRRDSLARTRWPHSDRTHHTSTSYKRNWIICTSISTFQQMK